MKSIITPPPSLTLHTQGSPAGQLFCIIIIPPTVFEREKGREEGLEGERKEGKKVREKTNHPMCRPFSKLSPWPWNLNPPRLLIPFSGSFWITVCSSTHHPQMTLDMIFIWEVRFLWNQRFQLLGTGEDRYANKRFQLSSRSPVSLCQG